MSLGVKKSKIRKAQCVGEKYNWVVGSGCYEVKPKAVTSAKPKAVAKPVGKKRPKIRKGECIGERYNWVVGDGCYEVSVASDDMKMYLQIEKYFEMADVPVLPFVELQQFREEIIKKSGIRKARLVVDWKNVVKAFNVACKKFGVDKTKFSEVVRDLVLIRLTKDILQSKDVIDV